MNFEILKRSHVKRNIAITLIVIAIISVVILNFTRAKYRVTQSIPLVNGTINYIPYDFNMVAVYQENDNGEYEEIEIMPSNGYVINEEMSYCTVGSNRDENASLYTNGNGEHVISNLQKGSKCYLYFDEIKGPAAITLNKLGLTPSEETPEFNKTAQASCSSTSTCEETNGIYEGQDDDGTTYYWRGSVNNNWVQFGGFYWRIIRINGDGTIRIIYNGTSTATTGTGTQISTTVFNSNYENNAYVGFMYTVGEVHGLGNDSIIKEVLDNWYQENLITLSSYIDTDAGFCGDRTSYTDRAGETRGGGTGTIVTWYGAYVRFNNNLLPTLKCEYEEDLYTTSSSSKGNKALTYPVGLITADEVAYAGGDQGRSNNSYYLYTNQAYWTMSPDHLNGANTFVYYVSTSGAIADFYSVDGQEHEWSGENGSVGVRPVINLRSDVSLSGSGTVTDPYVVVGAS